MRGFPSGFTLLATVATIRRSGCFIKSTTEPGQVAFENINIKLSEIRWFDYSKAGRTLVSELSCGRAFERDALFLARDARYEDTTAWLSYYSDRNLCRYVRKQ